MIKDNYEKTADDALAEVYRAKKIFPDNFVNQHEGYAVILEEPLPEMVGNKGDNNQ